MAEEVVSSFPYEGWALEIRNALMGRGIDAEVIRIGPRAYPVYVDERDSEKAGEVLAELGYLACAIGSGARMSGTFSWYPDEDIDEIKDELEKAVEETVLAHAEMQAATFWSTPKDDEEGMIIVASFGDAVAQNGELGPARIPKGYMLREGGGKIPASEEEVDLQVVRDVIMQQEEFQIYPRSLAEDLLSQIIQEKYAGRAQAYVSVSGDSEYYELEKEEDGK